MLLVDFDRAEFPGAALDALDEVLSIIFTFPFIVAIASSPMLGEWIGWRRWAAIGVGFAACC